MCCKEKLTSLQRYGAAVAEYAQVLTQLCEQAGVLAKEEYEDLWLGTEEARLISAQERLNFEWHVSDHGC